MGEPVPIQFRTRANRLAWQIEREWTRKMALRDRLHMSRDGRDRQRLPIKSIKHRAPWSELEEINAES